MKLSKEIINKSAIKGYKKFEAYIKTTKYNYNKTVYINNKSKVIITCPIHGDFEQTPGNHSNGVGCPRCKFDKVASINTLTTEEFIDKALEVHGNKYAYDNTFYTKSRNKVTITCRIHGNFEQLPGDHLSGKGCKQCSVEKQTKDQTFTTEQFIRKAKEIHGKKYDYSKVVYTKMQDKVIIACKEHGEFEQKATNHVTQKQGCPACGNIQKLKKYQEHPTILYMLFFTNLNLYKIGITMEKRGVKIRYKDEKEPYTICKQIVFDKGESAYKLEQMLLNKYKSFSYIGPNVLKAGNTELFTKDILADHLEI